MTPAPDPPAATETGAPEPGQLLRGFRPFDRLSPEAAAAVEPLLEQRRYRLGQTLLRADVMPEGVLLLRSGTLRSLATDPRDGEPRTIEQLQPGALAGWCGLLRGEPCEELRASAEAELLLLPAAAFADLLAQHEALRRWFAITLPAAELFRLLDGLQRQDPQWLPALESWPAIRPRARLRSLPPATDAAGEAAEPLTLPSELRWYVSSGGTLGQPWPAGESPASAAADGGWLQGDRPSLADIALLPFVRQFRLTDPEAFDAEPDLAALQAWLQRFLASPALAAVMEGAWGPRQRWRSPRWLYHLALAEEWRAARRLGVYDRSTRGLSLAQVGFIHASHAHQLEDTWRRFYADAGEVVLLHIDPDRLAAAGVSVRLEPAPPSGERFPHLDGPLPLEAVRLAEPFQPPEPDPAPRATPAQASCP
ncbi:MAG: hypothetical protein RLZZ124_200 [Cyanobacteriota bacterium]